MYKIGKYLPSDPMGDLICDNYPMLLVMSRFGIDLGFGEDTIEETCKKNGVDVYTFLSVVNVLIAEDKKIIKIEFDKVSLSSLIRYLHSSHNYFLEYKLPSIRQKLIDSIDGKDDASVVIVNYYDEYLAEVHKHMMYEEDTLFPYINSVISGSGSEKYSIEVYSKHHSKVEAKLSEFKNIIIKYYPAKTTNELNNVLYDIFTCERDLASHNDIEDYLLVPTMKQLESIKRQ
ncbi:MAG: hemerythrin domain-containing protein [Rikenellaceae bacterium]